MFRCESLFHFVPFQCFQMNFTKLLSQDQSLQMLSRVLSTADPLSSRFAVYSRNTRSSIEKDLKAIF